MGKTYHPVNPPDPDQDLAYARLMEGVGHLMREDPPADTARGRLLSGVVDAIEAYEKETVKFS